MRVRTTAFVAALALATAASAQYVVQDLGVLPGGGNSYGYKINDGGMVVGFSETSQGARGFVWTQQGGMVSVGRLRNDPSSFALGLNNSGAVVGYSGSGAVRTGFSWTQGGGIQDIGTYGTDPVSLAMSVNSSGQIVGLSGDDGLIKRAFSYSAPDMADLGPVPGKDSAFARGINDTGDVVGHSVGTDSVAFYWSQTTGMTALVGLSSAPSTAYAINEAGRIVGFATTSSGFKHAVAWSTHGSAPIVLDAGLTGSTAAEALDVNSQGRTVGFGVFAGQERAFLYDPLLGARRLDAVLGTAGAGWTFVRAQGINESGQIVGYGLVGGKTHAFVASPVPEPTSLLVLLAGFAALRFKGREHRVA